MLKCKRVASTVLMFLCFSLISAPAFARAQKSKPAVRGKKPAIARIASVPASATRVPVSALAEIAWGAVEGIQAERGRTKFTSATLLSSPTAPSVSDNSTTKNSTKGLNTTLAPPLAAKRIQ